MNIDFLHIKLNIHQEIHKARNGCGGLHRTMALRNLKRGLKRRDMKV